MFCKWALETYGANSATGYLKDISIKLLLSFK